MSELDDLLDKLTTGTIITTILGDGTKHQEFHDGLIPQLRSSVASSLVGGAAAGALPNERLPFDADALELYQGIERAIGEQFVELGLGVPGLLPELNLRRIYAALNDEDTETVARTWRRWATTIEGKFDPVRTLTITEPCPVCGAVTWKSPSGDIMADPVVIEFRGKSTDAVPDISDAVARCRASSDDGPCSGYWAGEQEIRALRWGLSAEEAVSEGDERMST